MKAEKAYLEAVRLAPTESPLLKKEGRSGQFSGKVRWIYYIGITKPGEWGTLWAEGNSWEHAIAEYRNLLESLKPAVEHVASSD